MLKKILCPGPRHDKLNFKKFLVAYRSDVSMAGVELIVHCDGFHCKKWFRIRFNKRGAPVVTEVPKGYHFDFECDPVPVKAVE